MENEKQKIRCAIYTRKSTSEGLDGDFTTLDAQRESALNFIASQKHSGWQASSQKYDDGGYTGATTDRPALQKLIQDIKDKKIDCVVVYKVDRLSRSLLDFVKLLQFFEDHQITFVSVTQHFNTNTSMGRLTLNILLSFAQFEREMISERTKDKMGAARKKGRWCGGRPPLGYDSDPKSKKLIINTNEAPIVKQIFDLYLKTKSMLNTARELNRLAYLTKRYTSKKGTTGGVPFKNSNIQMMINNVTYIGKVAYEGKVYPGEHVPIIADAIFNQAQELLKSNKRVRGVSSNRKFQGLLSGIFRCSYCKMAMCHGYTRKKNYKYRYYTCLNAIKRNRKECPTKSMNAQTIEERCLRFIRTVSIDTRIDEIAWQGLSLEEQMSVIREIAQLISYDGTLGKLEIFLRTGAKHDFNLPLLEIKTSLRNTVHGNYEAEPPIRRQLLLAHQIQKKLHSGEIIDLKKLAEWMNVSKKRLDQILNLLYLSPPIQEDILMGDRFQIARISERQLRPVFGEISWDRQMAYWAVLRPTA